MCVYVSVIDYKHFFFVLKVHFFFPSGIKRNQNFLWAPEYSHLGYLF